MQKLEAEKIMTPYIVIYGRIIFINSRPSDPIVRFFLPPKMIAASVPHLKLLRTASIF